MLVLFPYDEDRFDPERPPKTAIIRLVDFERLSRLAEVGAPGQQSWVRAVSAVHHILRKGAREAVVETELGLVASGRSPWVWRLPVSGARDIEATLDGGKAPILIMPGGQVGELAIPSAGRHVLAVRRSFAIVSEAGVESLSFPVNPIAVARVVVARAGPSEETPVLTARGGAELQSDGTLMSRLGPVEKVELRWAGSACRPGAEARRHECGRAGTLGYWAGGRPRAHEALVSIAASVESVRLAHPAGLILRGARVLGSGAYVRCESAGKDEWVLQFDSPLEAGGTIEIDCWMPSAMLGSRAGGAGHARAGLRVLAAVQPIGAERTAARWEFADPATGRVVSKRSREPSRSRKSRS